MLTCYMCQVDIITHEKMKNYDVPPKMAALEGVRFPK